MQSEPFKRQHQLPQVFSGLQRTYLWQHCFQSYPSRQNLKPDDQRSTVSDSEFLRFASVRKKVYFVFRNVSF